LRSHVGSVIAIAREAPEKMDLRERIICFVPDLITFKKRDGADTAR
jgi:hypothetical protein